MIEKETQQSHRFTKSLSPKTEEDVGSLLLCPALRRPKDPSRTHRVELRGRCDRTLQRRTASASRRAGANPGEGRRRRGNPQPPTPVPDLDPPPGPAAPISHTRGRLEASDVGRATTTAAAGTAAGSGSRKGPLSGLPKARRSRERVHSPTRPGLPQLQQSGKKVTETLSWTSLRLSKPNHHRRTPPLRKYKETVGMDVGTVDIWLPTSSHRFRPSRYRQPTDP